MGFKFNKMASYDLPEGDYRVFVRDSFVKADDSFRMVFEVTSLIDPVITYLAGKNYPDGKPTLAEDLVNWLGEEFVRTLIKPGGTIDAAKLKGLAADIRIEHWHNDDWAKPFAKIVKIAPAGTLIAD